MHAEQGNFTQIKGGKASWTVIKDRLSNRFAYMRDAAQYSKGSERGAIEYNPMKVEYRSNFSIGASYKNQEQSPEYLLKFLLRVIFRWRLRFKNLMK
jgi:hypothetical protein